MNWSTRYYYMPQYEYVSINQHGSRYKIKGNKKLNVVRITCETDDVNGMRRLVLFSHHLSVPVHYSFEDEHSAYIELISADAIRGNV